MASQDTDEEEGWFTTKKRGRDDEKIQADREKALFERRRKRNPNSKPSTKVGSKKPKTTLKTKRSFESDEDEDSFIEDDSEVESDDEKEWSEQDEEGDDEDDEDEDSSDEEGTFFQTYRSRSSIPPPKMSRAMKVNTKKANQKHSNGSKKLPPQKKKVIEVLSSSDSGQDSDSHHAPSKKQSKSQAKLRRMVKKLQGPLSDSESAGYKENFLDSPLPQARKILRLKQTASVHDINESSDDDIPSASKLGRPSMPLLATLFSAKTTNEPKVHLDDGNFSSPSPVMNRNGKKKLQKYQPANKKSPYFPDEEDSDAAASDSEAIAIALAMSASEKDVNQTGPFKQSERQTTHNEVVDLLDTDDEGDRHEEEEQEEYVDPDAEEAVSVLETANALSKEILTTMLTWMNGGDCNGSKETEVTAPMGMIVDGALALSTATAAASASAQRTGKTTASWISKETMKIVCPNIELADYQLIGVNWLALMHNMKCVVKGSGGKHTSVNGVLADEMGLGKTVQTIAFLGWLKYSLGNESSSRKNSSEGQSSNPHLIVVPSSVVSNWVREFETFAPHLSVVKYYGTQAEREEIQDQLRCHLPGARRPADQAAIDVIIVPVTYYSNENPSDRNFLRKFRFNYLICDEAHLLKNAKGSRYKNLDKVTSQHRLLLTGTPVQNHPSELLALLCFLMPLFSTRKYKSYEEDDMATPGESMLQHFVDIERREDKSDESAYRKLKQLFAPFVLRRKKEDVLGQIVPPKSVRVEFVELDKDARDLYDSIIANHIQGRKNGFGRDGPIHLFTQLRKAAHHPLLIRSRHKTESEKQQLAKLFHAYQAFQGGTVEQVAAELDSFNDFEIHHTALDLIEQNECRRENLEPYILREEDLFCSTKFVRLRSLLPELIADGHRILIFSVWTSCLDLLGCLLESMEVNFLRMDGQTPVRERQSLMDLFQKDSSIPVFLLSTKACGMGITLTAADVCIMHDIDFNPFNDKQAEDRCHRIGQKKPVTVIKLVTKSTVDEDVYNMQERKAKMNDAIMENAKGRKEEREKKDVLQNAIDRYLHTPSTKPKAVSPPS